ncbi:MAG: SPOR domain-containing protein [Nitrosomonadales bacterium]|nr:SPOR domain-containing protein [Nitrosomonadales bacterium]
MKALVWILLLGNAIFFAVMQWGGLLAADEQAAQAQPPLHEEKISVLSVPQGKPAAVLPASAPAAAEPPQPPLSGGSDSPPLTRGGREGLPAKPDVACMEWGEFSGADLARATAALSTLQLGDKLSQRQVEYSIGYWVYIPPQKNKAAVNQKIAQLKARGVDEYFVVPDAGPWLNAISLGVFKTREAAQHFLDELRDSKGVRSAQIGERASKLKATLFVLNGLDAKTGTELARIQKDFAGSELKDISCALTR